jgi:hypothetical protein
VNAMPLEIMNQRPESLMANVARTRLSILLIGPITAPPLHDRQSFLSDVDFRVTFARDLRELSLLRAAEVFALSLISDTLGATGLDDAARSVRKQWPTSRILVLGQASDILEDYLYDDALPHSCSQQGLYDTVDRMFGQRVLGRPFILSTPASEHDPLKRRPVGSAVSCLSNCPERMTQTQF